MRRFHRCQPYYCLPVRYLVLRDLSGLGVFFDCRREDEVGKAVGLGLMNGGL